MTEVPLWAVFRGLGALVVAIVLNASISLGQSTLREWQGVLLASLALLALSVKAGFPMIAAGAAALALVLYPRPATASVRRPPGAP